MKKVIHVKPRIIASNFTNKTNDPPLVIYYSNGVTERAHCVTIDGPSKVIHDNEHPLATGARVWIETESEITIS